MDSDSNISVDEAVLKCAYCPSLSVDNVTNILEGLPEGAELTAVTPWGTSAWTQTTRVSAKSRDGEKHEYFLKTSSTDFARIMCEGEFRSLETMYELMPDSCPRPRGYGEFKSSPGTFFVIMDFLFLFAEHPDPAKITQLIADLHKRTQGQSPDNKFGFYVPNCHGKVVCPNDWDADWSRYFTRFLKIFYDLDIKTNGTYPGYEETFATLTTQVIPRLLGALQSDGRVLIPSLVHGDLWQENIASNEETDEPMIYDPNTFFAHNEFDIGIWRTVFVPFDESYMKQYRLRFPPSEPAEEWDDRNRLYSLIFHISHSAHWLGTSDNLKPM